MRLCIAVSVVISVFFAACVVSPVPQPPNVDPPTLDLGEVAGMECGTCDIEEYVLTGGEGSVTHPEITEGIIIWVVDLDQATPPRTAAVADDGSFEVFLEGMGLETYRLQARVEGSRSPPVDITFEWGNPDPIVLEHSLEACFEVSPEPELELEGTGDVASVEVHNRCGDPLTVDFVGLRAPSEAFSVTGAPSRLDPESTAVVEVELLATEPGLHEEILLIEVSGPADDRLAVTLFGVL